jgi:flagellum-specific peptidoglycan hydrolase FlgJ
MFYFCFMNIFNYRRFFRIFAVVYGFFVLLHYCRNVEKEEAPVRPPHTEAYIRQFGPVARDVSKQTGVPPSIILAVAGLESGWGGSELAQHGNNHFGIKAKSNQHPRKCLSTTEFYRRKRHRVRACFRAYFQPQDSFHDFASMLRADPRYESLFNIRSADYESWAEGLASCGYATDPKYAQKLIRLVRKYRLDLVDKG